MGNFDKLLESISFRFKSIFAFRKTTISYKLCKIVLLLIFILPFSLLELAGVVFSLCSYLPIIGIIFNLTICIIIDLLASILFCLILLPDTNTGSKNT